MSVLRPDEPHLISINISRLRSPALEQPPLVQDSQQPQSLVRNPSQTNDPALVIRPPAGSDKLYLGETFSALVSVINEAILRPNGLSTASNPVVKVELLTGEAGLGGAGGSKHLLLSVNSNDLEPGQKVDSVVKHEIKATGTHTVVCIVTYGQLKQEEGVAPVMISRSTRNLYRFEVTNPLSVRTKFHSTDPRTATTFLSSSSRHSVYLELQVSNKCDASLAFEKMQFQPEANWTVFDVNHLASDSSKSLFEGASAFLPPNSFRQYLFVLTPKNGGKGYVVPLPGSTQPLGRLDIQWTSPVGEPARLQTSMLTRRVPALPLPVEPELDSDSTATNPPPAPVEKDSRSPAPYPNQRVAQLLPGRTATPPPPPPPPHSSAAQPDASGLEFDLTVTSILPFKIAREKPFTITFSLTTRDHTLSRAIASSSTSPPPRRRKLRIVAQHVQYHLTPTSRPLSSSTTARPNSSHRRTETPVRNSSETVRSALGGIPLPPPPQLNEIGGIESTPFSPQNQWNEEVTELPFPVAEKDRIEKELRYIPNREIIKLGSSVVNLEEVVIDYEPQEATGEEEGEEEGQPAEGARRKPVGGKSSGAETTVQFKMKFYALTTGLFRVGGLRIILLESEFESASGAPGEEEEKEGAGEALTRVSSSKKGRIVLELTTVAEVWVHSLSRA